MNKKDIQNFTDKLLKEKKLLEEELRSIGKANPGSANGWDATAGKIEVDPADENEVADKMEELEENELILGKLDAQLKDVDAALDRISKDEYGNCEVCGKPIEKERLEANASAKTCKEHMK